MKSFILFSVFLIQVYSKEIHIPGYNYCGPGTNFINKTKNKITPINSLDLCCFKHDETYINNNYTFSKESDKEFIRCSKNVFKTTSDKKEKKWAFLAIYAFRVKLFYLLKIKRLENRTYKA
tara:strand:+ start:235 stop:597 length:363 start_codon:yes stop_codon:yes gene_type:complete